MVFVKKSEHAITGLGKRIIAKSEALVDSRTLELGEA